MVLLPQFLRTLNSGTDQSAARILIGKRLRTYSTSCQHNAAARKEEKKNLLSSLHVTIYFLIRVAVNFHSCSANEFVYSVIYIFEREQLFVSMCK